jgi:hypothetical protein
MINPECLASMLVCEVMEENEAIAIIGERDALNFPAIVLFANLLIALQVLNSSATTR